MIEKNIFYHVWVRQVVTGLSVGSKLIGLNL